MGYFIAIDGLSGSGKSTAITEVCNALRRRGLKVGVYHDRLGEPNAAQIDVLQHSLNLSPLARLYFMLAVRRQVIDGAIMQSLAQDDITIADRYYSSTIAYQGYGQGIDPPAVAKLAKAAAAGAEPDRFFYLDVTADVALERMAVRGGGVQVFDTEQAAFHEDVRRGYLEQARLDERFTVIDASQSIEHVARSVVTVAMRDLMRRNLLLRIG